ncbi:MAG TPA: hypothetical protein VM264_01680 [Acidimicrobiales bacterium]|nr:hypothetical protein [Acidimicrobiales bacterium]
MTPPPRRRLASRLRWRPAPPRPVLASRRPAGPAEWALSAAVALLRAGGRCLRPAPAARGGRRRSVVARAHQRARLMVGRRLRR